MTKNNLEHQLDRYVEVVSCTHEIVSHLDNIDNDSADMMVFHMAHIQKAAQKIRFIEEICIISGAEVLTKNELRTLWAVVEDDIDIWVADKFIHSDAGMIIGRFEYPWTTEHIMRVVLKHQSEYKTLPTLTAPF